MTMSRTLLINPSLKFAAVLQSQRDCVFQPRVARHELPWVIFVLVFNPNGVVARLLGRAITPLGLFASHPFSQGSSFLATLGYESESLWDSTAQILEDIQLLVRSYSPESQFLKIYDQEN